MLLLFSDACHLLLPIHFQNCFPPGNCLKLLKVLNVALVCLLYRFSLSLVEIQLTLGYELSHLCFLKFGHFSFTLNSLDISPLITINSSISNFVWLSELLFVYNKFRSNNANIYSLLKRL